MRLAFLLLSVCLLSLSPAARGQATNEPIKLVVGVAPGGTLDLSARIIAEQLQKLMKRAAIVDNRPGANTLIATKRVSSSPPDGNTLLVTTVAITTLPALFPKEKVDPLIDLTPISMMVVARLALVANPKLPVKSVRELIDYAKSRPGSLNYGAGTTTFQVATELLMQQTGIKLTRIPYNGTAPTLNALLGGQIDVAVLDVGISLPHLKSRDLNALMVLSQERSASIPQVPTAKEVGFPDLQVETWVAVFGPPRMAPEMVERLNAAISEGLQDSESRQRFASLGIEVVSYSVSKTRDRIERDAKVFGKVMEKANATGN